MVLPMFAMGAPSIFGNILGGLSGLFGGMQAAKHLRQGRRDILNLPGMEGLNLGTSLGFAGQGGSMLSPEFMNLQNMLGGISPQLLQGGLAQDAGINAALGGASAAMSPAFLGADFALQQQIGPEAFQGLMGGIGQNALGLSNLFTDQLALGPQDYTGGMQSALMGSGAGLMDAAANLPQLQQEALDIQRQAFAPEAQRRTTGMYDDLFSKGLLGGGTDTASQSGIVRNVMDSLNQADLSFQNRAFDIGQQRAGFLGNLGAQQVGLGADIFGQNLGQYANLMQGAQGFGQLGLGAEAQGFNQLLQSVGQNQQSAMQRLQNAQGMFGFGGDLFGQQFNLGLGGLEGMLGLGNLGIDLTRMPYELQAGLLQGSGYHSQALGNIAEARANASGGLFGGLGSALGNIFSDKRLKDNIKRIGTLGKFGWYEWDWNSAARRVGADTQPNYGVIAQEVAEKQPDAVGQRDGYLTVHYDMLLGV